MLPSKALESFVNQKQFIEMDFWDFIINFDAMLNFETINWKTKDFKQFWNESEEHCT